VAVTAQDEAGRRQAPRRLSDLRTGDPRKPLAYLDSAVSSHKPRQVLDKLRTFYETSYANVHRGVYTLSEIATAEYEGAREKVAQFVNARDTRELIFTHGATESINLVAYAWGLDNLGPGDVVVVTELEHHSNFVPGSTSPSATARPSPRSRWTSTGSSASTRSTRSRGWGTSRLSPTTSSRMRSARSTRSSSLQPGPRQGAIMVVDAAQAAPHHAIDVQQLNCDFLAFSSHKMCGPTSVGALWGRASLLERWRRFNLGAT